MEGNMKKRELKIKLGSEAIDQASEILQDRMREKNVQDRNLQRTRLAVETILLNLSEHYAEGKEVTLITRTILGRKSLCIRYDGEPYNPLHSDDTDEWTERFLADISMKPSWKYTNNTNEIYLRIPRNKLRDDVMLLIALFIAVILGFVGAYLPSDVVNNGITYVFSPISTIFMNILKSLAGLLIFLSIITGICGIGSLSEFSKVGKYLIGRYLFFTFAGAAFCILAMLPLHHIAFGAGQGSTQWNKIFDMVMKIIPDNPITPFIECNLLQIVFLAILIGIGILVLLRESAELHAVLIQTKNVVMYLVGLLCHLLPLYIIASLTILFWQNGMGVFKSIWKPLLFVVIFLHLMALFKVASVSIRCKISPILLLKKAAPSYLIGLSTASSMAALGTMLEANEKRFGIPKNFSDFGVPIGNTIGRHMVSGGFVIVMFFLAEYAGISINIGWLISLWLYVSIVSFANPPIAGGVLICLGVMLTQFGIPEQYLGLGAPLTLLSDFVMAGAYVLDEHMEMVLQSRHWGTLDEKMLRSKEE